MSAQNTWALMGLFGVNLFVAIALAALAFSLASWFGMTFSAAEAIEATAAILSAVALVGLIYGVHLQARAVQNSADAAVASRQLEIDRLFVERPWLRPFSLEGQIARPGSQYAEEVQGAAALYANFFDGYFQARAQGRQLFVDKQWRAYMLDHLAQSPALRDHIAQRPGWYCDGLVKLSKEAAGQRSV